MEILGQRLLLLRKQKGLAQKDVAERIGISFNSYCRYEKNEREPMAPTIVALADFFQVSTDYLLGRTDQP
ncbi:helix-turn-helix domain-containing protein [uncultured Flavonifractor sp.]|uniref:helix-turn-helix domain-containing protein n=1 Tax=uncultured Flavonifractor sp. TaxID=1193534 RepID=UPI00262BE3AA|nr:helix-turn-helix transcriptional regulator [uncultured Flavonifractor sp.]